MEEQKLSPNIYFVAVCIRSQVLEHLHLTFLR